MGKSEQRVVATYRRRRGSAPVQLRVPRGAAHGSDELQQRRAGAPGDSPRRAGRALVSSDRCQLKRSALELGSVGGVAIRYLPWRRWAGGHHRRARRRGAPLKTPVAMSGERCRGSGHVPAPHAAQSSRRGQRGSHCAHGGQGGGQRDSGAIPEAARTDAALTEPARLAGASRARGLSSARCAGQASPLRHVDGPARPRPPAGRRHRVLGCRAPSGRPRGRRPPAPPPAPSFRAGALLVVVSGVRRWAAQTRPASCARSWPRRRPRESGLSCSLARARTPAHRGALRRRDAAAVLVVTFDWTCRRAGLFEAPGSRRVSGAEPGRLLALARAHADEVFVGARRWLAAPPGRVDTPRAAGAGLALLPVAAARPPLRPLPAPEPVPSEALRRVRALLEAELAASPPPPRRDVLRDLPCACGGARAGRSREGAPALSRAGDGRRRGRWARTAWASWRARQRPGQGNAPCQGTRRDVAALVATPCLGRRRGPFRRGQRPPSRAPSLARRPQRAPPARQQRGPRGRL